MALTVGDVVTKNNCKRAICLMTGQTANQAAPTVATDGVANYPSKRLEEASDVGAGYLGQSAESSTLCIKSTAGSGVMVGTFTLWGLIVDLDGAAHWFAVPVNGGSALAEDTTDAIFHVEQFANLGHFDRLALQLTSVGGTGTTFEAFLVTHRQGLC